MRIYGYAAREGGQPSPLHAREGGLRLKEQYSSVARRKTLPSSAG